MPDNDKNQHIFQCRVLTGHYDVGKPDLVEPPVRDKKSLALYNSVVNSVKKPIIFVVFHDTQVYPEYLIVFQQWYSVTYNGRYLSVYFRICGVNSVIASDLSKLSRVIFMYAKVNWAPLIMRVFLVQLVMSMDK